MVSLQCSAQIFFYWQSFVFTANGFHISRAPVGAPGSARGLGHPNTAFRLQGSAGFTAPRPKRPSIYDDSAPGDGPVKKKLHPKAAKKAKLARQRAGGSGESGLVVSARPREVMAVRVSEMKRGEKSVTIVRGLELALDERKGLLKELKTAVGGGGGCDAASGVLELQGAHGEKICALLVKKNFALAKCGR